MASAGPPGSYKYKRGTAILVNGLGTSVRKTDLQEAFGDFGHITDIQLEDGWARLEFDDARDARDAVENMAGKQVLRNRVAVELDTKLNNNLNRKNKPKAKMLPMLRRSRSRNAEKAPILRNPILRDRKRAAAAEEGNAVPTSSASHRGGFEQRDTHGRTDGSDGLQTMMCLELNDVRDAPAAMELIKKLFATDTQGQQVVIETNGTELHCNAESKEAAMDVMQRILTGRGRMSKQREVW